MRKFMVWETCIISMCSRNKWTGSKKDVILFYSWGIRGKAMEALLRSSLSRSETRQNQNPYVFTLSSSLCRLCKSSLLCFLVHWLLRKHGRTSFMPSQLAKVRSGEEIPHRVVISDAISFASKRLSAW